MIDLVTRHEQRRFEHVLALGLEGEARRGGVDRRLERGGHLALRRPRKRLALRGVLDAAHASQPDAALARDGPAHGSRARDSRIVIHDDDARAECLVWSLDDSRRTVGLSTQRVDDHASRPECLRERRQRCVLFLPRSVQQSPANGRKGIDQVEDERAPARLELARSHVLGCDTHEQRVIVLRRADVLIEARMRRRQTHAALRPVHWLESGVAPRWLVVRDWKAIADVVPHRRADGRQRLRAERGDDQGLGVDDVFPRPLFPAEPQVHVGFAAGGKRRPRRVQRLEAGLQVLVDRMVLAHHVHVAHVGVVRQPRRVVVCDPHGDGRVVSQQLDHLGLHLFCRRLEEARVVRTRLIRVGAEQRQFLQQQHSRLVCQPVEIAWQHVGDHPQGIEVRFLRQPQVCRELLGGELVHSMRWRVARAAQEHRAVVYREAPPARADVPFEVPEPERILHAGRFRAAHLHCHLGAVESWLPESPRLPPERARQRQAHGNRVVAPAGDAKLALVHLQVQAAVRSPRHRRDHELHLAVHLPAVQVAQPRLHLEAPVAGFEARLEAKPVDDDRADVLELDRPPQPERHLPPVRLAEAHVSRGRVGPQVAVVEVAHYMALAVELRLDRRFAADDELVFWLQVGSEVEAEGREVAVVRSQKATVQPRMSGGERAADPQHDAARVVGFRKHRPVPHALCAARR